MVVLAMSDYDMPEGFNPIAGTDWMIDSVYSGLQLAPEFCLLYQRPPQSLRDSSPNKLGERGFTTFKHAPPASLGELSEGLRGPPDQQKLMGLWLDFSAFRAGCSFVA
jgi:hypothetical protein